MNITYEQACEYYAVQGYDMATLLDSYSHSDSAKTKTFEDWLINEAMEDDYATINNV